MHTTDPELERKEILKHYRKLLRTAKPFLKEDDAKLIKKAFNFSAESHKDMRRKSGEPYIFHPLAVAQICVEEINLGTTSIIAALLHDVVEDTDAEVEDIERLFGKKVARIIDGLTKISGVFEMGTSSQAENFRKLLLTLSDDVRVILIKIADRLHNMRTMDSMPRDKQLKIASETIYLYAPLAHRLGMYPIKTELEDLYLKYTDSVIYKEIALKLKQTKSARSKFVREFIKPLEKELGKTGVEFEIKGRPKSIYSIWNKIKRQNVPFEEVYDLFAIRIILDAPPEKEKSVCWQAYSIVTDLYKPNPDRLRDWVSTPKANGYESLHTTVMSKTGQWVEVQIRSKRMDEIAEKGYAAHWKYKESGSANQKNDRGIELWIAKVRELLSGKDASSSIDFVDEFRSNLFNKEVFVFTPKGDLKVLPNNATALDFAFEIHTQIGAKCLGAKVNQKLVPLSHKLNNGDQIEIITSNKQKPNEGWLKFVVTSKAKAKIKDYLKEEMRKAAVDGKEIIERKLKNLKLELNTETINKLLEHYHEKNALDFYAKIAEGTISTIELKDILAVPEQVNDTARSKKENKFKGAILEIDPARKGTHTEVRFGESSEKMEYSLAKCCNPIPGDEVFGFVTVSEGIKIHRTSCPNAIELMSHYGYRIIKARWANQEEKDFLTGLKIRGADTLGMLNNITTLIYGQYKVNIRSLKIDTNDGMFEGDIMLFVHDTKHLENLISNLKKIPGVVNVSRYET